MASTRDDDGGGGSVLAGAIGFAAAGVALAALPLAIGAAFAGAGGVWLLGRVAFRAGVRSSRREVERIMDAVEARVTQAIAAGGESAVPERTERRLATTDSASDSHG